MARPNKRRGRDGKVQRQERAAARKAAWDAMTIPDRARKKRAEGHNDEADRLVADLTGGK